MKIVIPTYRREKQLTYGFLSKASKRNTVFVVDEADARRLKWFALEPDQIHVHPPEIKTIAAKMSYIFAAMGLQKIMLFDDDLRFAIRRDFMGSTSLKPATADEIDNKLETIAADLDKFPQAGLGARQGNNNQKLPMELCAKAMYAIGYDCRVMREQCVLNRIEYRADYDYTLQLLRKGYQNKIYHDLVVDQSYNNPGGCSEQRTVERNDEDALLLAKLHPGLVRVVDKEYKASLKRKECVVSWKKAFLQRQQ